MTTFFSKSALCIFIILLFSFTSTYAINYNISFSASGAGNVLDSVIVENLTQATQSTIVGEEILNLSDFTTLINPSLPAKMLMIYPTPAPGISKISFYADKGGMVKVNILDVDGRKVFGTSVNTHPGYNYYELSIGKGIYFLQLIRDAFSYSSKIISLNENNTRLTFSESDNYEQNIRQNAPMSLISMSYRSGDILLFKGYSGNYCTIIPDVPTESKQVNFKLFECKDADGYFYPVTKIGNQYWMAGNLKTGKYQNQINIADKTTVENWDTINSDAYSNYSQIHAAQSFGKLYNWVTVSNENKLAPRGWHIPTDDEWSELSDFLGGQTEAGIKLKEKGSPFWSQHSAGPFNSSGFSALPGGMKSDHGNIVEFGSSGYWWSASTDSLSDSVWCRHLNNSSDVLHRKKIKKTYGISVRCLAGDLPELTTSAVDSINSFSAKCAGTITFDGNQDIISKGFCWSKSPNPTTANEKTSGVTGDDVFKGKLTGLDPETTYFVRAYATNNMGTTYGEELSFTTAKTNLSIAGYSSGIILFKHTDGRLFCTRSGDLSTFDRNGANKVTVYNFTTNGYSGYNIHQAILLPGGTIMVALTNYKNTLKFLRSTNSSYTSWELVHEDWNGQMLYRGWLVAPDGTLYAGEYPTHNNIDKVRLWKATDNGKNWSVVHTWNGRQGTITDEKTIFHIHVVGYDKYTGLLWVGCGDTWAEPAVYTYDGIKMTLIGEGSQLWRQCSFVFTPDHVIWGTDGWVLHDKIYKCRMVRYDKAAKTTEIVATTESTLFNCEEIKGFNQPLYLSCGTPNEVFLSNDGINWNKVMNLQVNPEISTNSWFYNFVDNGDGRLFAYITGIMRHDTGLPFTNGGTIILDIK